MESLKIKELGKIQLYEFGIALYRGKLKDRGISQKIKFIENIN